MDKSAQIDQALGRLSTKDALALARAVELARAKGEETLPTEVLLASLRPALRQAKAPRVPDLRRLVARAFEPFLSDRDDEPRVPGLIPRAALAPWWRALGHCAGAEMALWAERLAALPPDGTRGAREDFAREARAAAAEWTRALAAALARSKPEPALRKLVSRPALIADIAVMAAVLAMAEPLEAALAAIDRIQAVHGKLEGRRIVEFMPDAVTAAKQHYVALSESHGMDSCYLALAILNRLDQPSHILRLGRALSWKPDESMLRDTEFGVVGERLVSDLQRSAHDVAALAVRRGDAPDIDRLGAALSCYMRDAEGLLAEFNFRRDSAWGERILETRAQLIAALSGDWLARLAATAVLERILPLQRRGAEPELRAPDADAAAAAIETGRFLAKLAQRGSRHGLGHARDAVDALGEEIERRAATLLELLREAPDNAPVAAQLAAAVQVLAVLFEDGRGDTLARRIRIAAPVAV
jgi:hypothetical protein